VLLLSTVFLNMKIVLDLTSSFVVPPPDNIVAIKITTIAISSMKNSREMHLLSTNLEYFCHEGEPL
jgi:hypothetical protein